MLRPPKGTDPEIEALKRRYRAAMDAVFGGIEMNMTQDKTEGAPKKLRFGVVSALVSVNALARLLKEKGILGHKEHLEALAQAAEDEQASYERLLTARFGRDVKLQGK